MKLSDCKVDFHVSGWISEVKPEKGFSKILAELIEPHPKTLKYITDNLYSSSSNRVVFLVNYFQPKYERLKGQAISLTNQGYEIDDNNIDTFIGITNNRKDWMYLVRGYEIMSDRGHVIIAGIKDVYPFENSHYTYGPNLEKVLSWATKKEALTIPAHPLHTNYLEKSLLASLALAGRRDPSGLSLGLSQETLEEFRDDFDAIEAFSLSISPSQSRRIREFAKKIDKPILANSDGTIMSAFSSYNEFGSIDFTSPESMRDSIRQALLSREKVKPIYVQETDGSRLKEKVLHFFMNFVQERENF